MPPAEAKKYNGSLTTISGDGEEHVTDIRITNYSTDLTMAVVKHQLRLGEAIRPKRIQERFISFTLIWPEKEWDKREELSERIYRHTIAALNQDRPTKIRFIYDALDVPLYGFIESAPLGAKAHQVTYDMQLRMKLVNVNNGEPSRMSKQGKAPYLPTSQSLDSYGAGWFAFKDTHLVNYDTYWDWRERYVSSQARGFFDNMFGGGDSTSGAPVSNRPTPDRPTRPQP